MRFEYAYALLAFGHAVAAQNSTYTPPSLSTSSTTTTSLLPSSLTTTTTTTPGSSISSSASTRTSRSTSSTVTSRSSTSSSTVSSSVTTSSSTSRSTVGLETVSIVGGPTPAARLRRADLAERQAAVSAVYICPIFAQQVPNAPCYPCAVGQPSGLQTLLVQTTSTLNVAPDATPIFAYSFCVGCAPNRVTTPVPGYTPGARNFATCAPGIVTSAPSASPTPTSMVGPPGITTNIYVTATIYNLIEIVSYCPTNGARQTILEQSTSCSTYSTCVTIPPELCTTTESTENGAVVVYTEPVETWTQMLTTAVTTTVSTITATSPTPVETVAPAGYTVVASAGAAAAAAAGGAAAGAAASAAAAQPAAAGAAAGAAASAAAAAPAAAPASTEGSSPAQETYATAGASQAFASVSAIVLSVVAFFMF